MPAVIPTLPKINMDTDFQYIDPKLIQRKRPCSDENSSPPMKYAKTSDSTLEQMLTSKRTVPTKYEAKSKIPTAAPQTNETRPSQATSKKTSKEAEDARLRNFLIRKQKRMEEKKAGEVKVASVKATFEAFREERRLKMKMMNEGRIVEEPKKIQKKRSTGRRY